MAKLIPTKIGDVLILRTDKSFTLHVVGQVSKDGQQDFDTYLKANPNADANASVRHATNRADAIAWAKALLVPGGRIFFRDLDTGDWDQILE